MCLNLVDGIFFIRKFTILLMAAIYFEMHQKSNGAKDGERYRQMESKTLMAESDIVNFHVKFFQPPTPITVFSCKTPITVLALWGHFLFHANVTLSLENSIRVLLGFGL